MLPKTIERYTEPLIHLVGWAVLFGLPLIFTDRDSGINWMEFLRRLNGPLDILLVFYLNYLFLAPRLYLKGRHRAFYLANIIVCLLGCLFMAYWEHLFRQMGGFDHHAAGNHHFSPPPRLFFIMRDIIMQTLFVVFATAIRISKEWGKAEAARKEAELGRTEAELKNLRSQINPHFLLNTLNNIYALIQFNGEKAQEAVLDLSKLLRHILYENQSPYVPIEQEIDFLANYIRLMRIRLSENVEVTFETHLPENHSLRIAPLLYISLIENAFKHGISANESCFIHLTIDTSSDSILRFRLENSCHPKRTSDRSGSGIGLRQVQKRLDILYPGKYRWTKGTDASGKVYQSILEIETNPKNILQ